MLQNQVYLRNGVSLMNEATKLYQARCKELLNNGLDYLELGNYNNFSDCLSELDFKAVRNQYQNRKNKRYRTNQKYKELLKIKNSLSADSKIVFGTMTLDDKHLNQTEDSYIRKIDRWVKSHFIYAIVNKDFGDKTEREHYHFIGLTIEDLEKVNKKSKKGFEMYELVKKDYEVGFEPNLCIVDTNDIEKIKKYLVKFNNHSTKITTKSRLRVLKSSLASIIILQNGFEPTRAEKRAKKEHMKLLLEG